MSELKKYDIEVLSDDRYEHVPSDDGFYMISEEVEKVLKEKDEKISELESIIKSLTDKTEVERIKVITSRNSDKLERMVNDWIASKSGRITIKNIQICRSECVHDRSGEHLCHITAMITYTMRDSYAG